jgi:thiol-disulfide isomerase/thioredoxin
MKIFIVALSLVLFAAGCGGPRTPSKEELALFDFALKDDNGQEVKFASLKGKPLIVNFWATWCGPCKIETPMLVALSKKYKDQGLTILGVETDSDAAAVRQFRDAYKIPYPLVLAVDRTDVTTAFDWTGILPTSVFIRADGTIARRVIGLETEESWEQIIKTLF